ncbi:hypothetical protein TNCV_4224531 [Trichonephila clavipes]|nr:hypothetical protein TNCV_4224531 [Trichonephila clavipes]
MPSRHSVHDLELAVQDLWAHLPQDNIRCLINSMSDRVAAVTPKRLSGPPVNRDRLNAHPGSRMPNQLGSGTVRIT